MANPFYVATGNPGTRAPGASSPVRSEFSAIEDGFDKLPTTLTPNRALIINPGGTAITLTAGGLALAGDFSTVGGHSLAITTTANSAVTMPVTGTLATLAGAEALTNKTIGASNTIAGATINGAALNNPVTPIVTTAGSSTAYTLTYGVAPTLTDGTTHVVQFDETNGVAPTLNINALGAKAIHYYSVGAWRALPPGLLGANEVCRLVYHGGDDTYRIVDRPDTTGDWVPGGRTSARAGTILSYGQNLSRTEYAGLFAAYGTTFGSGDGSTTFTMPDLRGRAVAGKDDMGGSSANRLTSPINGDTLGAAGGTESHTHSLSVTVTASGLASVNLQTGGPTGDVAIVVGGGSTSATGPSHVHNISGDAPVSVSGSGSGTSGSGSSVQPTIIGNYAVCL